MQELAARTFEAVACEGLARVDFFVFPDGSLVVNEINTMPGFTPTSMYPQMWAASGLDYPELVDRLIQLALAAAPACADRGSALIGESPQMQGFSSSVCFLITGASVDSVSPAKATLLR
jgi:hypothetical protein